MIDYQDAVKLKEQADRAISLHYELSRRYLERDAEIIADYFSHFNIPYPIEVYVARQYDCEGLFIHVTLYHEEEYVSSDEKGHVDYFRLLSDPIWELREKDIKLGLVSSPDSIQISHYRIINRESLDSRRNDTFEVKNGKVTFFPKNT